MDCPYSEKQRQGLTQWMTCKITNERCVFVRMCRNINSVVNTDDARNCRIRKSKERGEGDV